MTSRYLELNNEIKIRLDLDADNQISFFDFTLPRRDLEEDDFRRINKAIENLKNKFQKSQTVPQNWTDKTLKYNYKMRKGNDPQTTQIKIL